MVDSDHKEHSIKRQQGSVDKPSAQFDAVLGDMTDQVTSLNLEPVPDNSAPLQHAKDPKDKSEQSDVSFGGERTLRDVRRWHHFGRRGYLRQTKAQRFSWNKLEPFHNPIRLEWLIPVKADDLLTLLHGVYPIEMEDKWLIFSEGPDANGKASVNFHRSWTGKKVAELELEVDWGTDSAEAVWTGQIVSMTMEGEVESRDEDEDESYEDFVKFEVLEACNWVLNIQLAEINEPRSWAELAKQPARTERLSQPRTLYKGTAMSKETLEDLMKLGDQIGPAYLS